MTTAGLFAPTDTVESHSAARVRLLASPAPRNLWLDIAAADPETQVYQTPAWTDAVCRAKGMVDASRLYRTSDGRLLLLPLVREPRPALLSAASSMPHAWGAGGLISAAPLQVDDIKAVFADLMSLPYLSVSLRPNPRHADLWKAAAPPGIIVKPSVSHVLNLEGGFEEVWNHRFTAKTRWAIGKAMRSDIVVDTASGTRLIPEFYGLLSMSFDRWAVRQNEPAFLARLRGRHRDPQEKFEAMAETLGERFSVSVAYVGGQPAAAIVVLQDRNVNYLRGAMNQELAAPVRANDLLQKLAIERACAAGSRLYHMGESGESRPLSQFKERFGAEPIPFADYRIEKLPVTPVTNAAKSVVKALIGFKDT